MVREATAPRSRMEKPRWPSRVWIKVSRKGRVCSSCPKRRSPFSVLGGVCTDRKQKPPSANQITQSGFTRAKHTQGSILPLQVSHKLWKRCCLQNGHRFVSWCTSPLISLLLKHKMNGFVDQTRDSSRPAFYFHQKTDWCYHKQPLGYHKQRR